MKSAQGNAATSPNGALLSIDTWNDVTNKRRRKHSSVFDIKLLKRWCDDLRLTGETYDHILHMYKTGPVRKPTSNGNVTGLFASRIMNAGIPYSSRSAELGFLWRADNPEVGTRVILPEPTYLRVTSKTAGGSSEHTYDYPPDFLWMTDRWAGFVECKWEHDIQWIIDPKNPKGKPGFFVAENNQWRCPAGEQAAAKLGLGFAVFVMKKSEMQLSANLELLADYFLDPNENYYPVTARKIKALATENPGIHVRHIQESLAPEEIDTLFFMIARGEVFVDIAHEPLAPNYTASVYADREAARLAGIISQIPAGLKQFTPEFHVESGAAFVLRGAPARILEVKGDLVTIAHGDSTETMAFEQLEALAVNGQASQPCKTATARDEAVQRLAEMRKWWPCMAHRLEIIRPYLDTSDPPPRPKSRTVYRWIKRYRQVEAEYGKGFGVLGLCPTKRSGNKNRKLDATVIQIMDDVISDYWAAKIRDKEVSWGEVRRRCNKHHPRLQPPSRAAFYSQLKRRMETGAEDLERKRHGDWYVYAKSAAVWQEEWEDYPVDGEFPWGQAHIDHKLSDCESARTPDGHYLGRCWKTVMISARYRRALAVTVSYEAPSYRSCMEVMRECVFRHHRLPRIIVTDNGKEFRSEYFTALLMRYGITQMFRPPRKPRFGAVLERLNLTLDTKVFHNLPGSTADMKQPRTVAPSHRARGRAAYSLAEIADLTRKTCYELLDTQLHDAFGATRRGAFNEDAKRGGSRSHTIIPYDQSFIILTAPTTKRGVATCSPRQGFIINRIPYWCAQAKDRRNAGKKFAVKYDPFDFSHAWVFIDDKWQECFSREFRYRFKGLTEREVQIATAEILAACRTLTEKRRAVNATTLAEFFVRNCDRPDIARARLRAAANAQASSHRRVLNHPPSKSAKRHPLVPRPSKSPYAFKGFALGGSK